MEPIERIREMLGRLDQLNAEELSELTELINSTYDEIEAGDPTNESVTLMGELIDGLSSVRAEQTNREAAAQEVVTAADEQRERMRQLREVENGETETETAAETETTETAETETADDETETETETATAETETPAATAETETAPEAVAASALPGSTVPAAARMARASRRPRPSPEAAPAARHPMTITAAAGLRDLNPGDTIADRMVLARATVDMLNGLHREGPATGTHVVARARWADAYPEERRLGPNATVNTERIDAVCSTQALVASGGTCLPVNVDYSVPTWATADRPLRDALPGFQADRGGLRYVTPPDIGVVDLQAASSGLGSATTVWTEATDASPGGAVKPVYHVVCGTEQLVYVDAVPTRVGFGNMQGRFAPEQVAAFTDLAIAAAAREAELNLLTEIYKNSKQIVASQYLGATRDLLSTADLLVEQYRYSHRIPSSVQLIAIFPEWAKGLIRADLAREIGHDNAGSQNVLAITDEQIESWFAVRGIQIIWTLDGVKAGTYGTGGQAITNQFFGLAAGGSSAPQWPGQSSSAAFTLGWMLYAEGSFQFLDGGRLDLGVVRDSTLDATNDYETFVETFEAVAYRGIDAFQVHQTVLPNGGSAGTNALTNYVE